MADKGSHSKGCGKQPAASKGCGKSNGKISGKSSGKGKSCGKGDSKGFDSHGKGYYESSGKGKGKHTGGGKGHGKYDGLYGYAEDYGYSKGYSDYDSYGYGKASLGKGKGKVPKGKGEAVEAKGTWWKGNHKGGAKDAWAKGKWSKGSGKGKRMPDPPVDEPGEWVPAQSFVGKKSFAFYRCYCGKTWTSAHGFKEFGQGCKSCEHESRPELMWQNAERRVGIHLDEERRNARDNQGEHDEERCAACRAGVCSAGRQY